MASKLKQTYGLWHWKELKRFWCWEGAAQNPVSLSSHTIHHHPHVPFIFVLTYHSQSLIFLQSFSHHIWRYGTSVLMNSKPCNARGNLRSKSESLLGIKSISSVFPYEQCTERSEFSARAQLRDMRAYCYWEDCRGLGIGILVRTDMPSMNSLWTT